MKMVIFILMFSLNVGAEIQAFDTFQAKQVSGESVYQQLKGVMSKLRKALKKEKLFRKVDFNRLKRFIQEEDFSLALRIIEDYEQKGHRQGVKKFATRLKERLVTLTQTGGGTSLNIQPREEECPGSGLEETEFSSTEKAFAALQPSGLVITWGAASSGGDAGEVADEINCGVIKVFSTQKAFAALKSNGAVITWGDPDYGGNSSSVSTRLESGVETIFSTQRAFAALKNDGSIVVWGNPLYGGEAATLRATYSNGNENWETFPLPTSLFDGSQGRIVKIVPSASAFAAIMEDKQDSSQKSVFAWGNDFMGGSLSIHDVLSQESGFYDQYKSYYGHVPEDAPIMKEIAPLLDNGSVIDIFSTDGAFAALKEDGSVITWGAGRNFFQHFPEVAHGGNSNLIDLQGNVKKIFSNSTAFAALKNDGSVVTWGHKYQGGDSSSVSNDLTGNVTDIASNEAGFAAIKDDGSVVIWGEYNNRKFNSTLGAPQNVIDLVASKQSFAALQRDGSVNSWGEILMQSDTKELVTSGVSAIFANDDAFAALKDDGGVITWGWENAGGDMPWAYNDYLNAWYELEAAEYNAGRTPDPEQIKAQVIHHLYRIKSGVIKIASTKAAFVALKKDGTIVTWGNPSYGGDSSSVATLFGTGGSN